MELSTSEEPGGGGIWCVATNSSKSELVAAEKTMADQQVRLGHCAASIRERLLRCINYPIEVQCCHNDFQIFARRD